ncbi:MAG TPA: PxKF domain-containing protein, partial [Candidatus Limnocylindrales bacterium]|nr:PxKF domain-containing protein [Candidatus Limnocylindrales bacterium]
IPFKFVLTDAHGNVIQPSAAPLWVIPIQEGPVTGSVDDTTPPTTPTNGVMYVWDGSQWHYNWNTPKADTGYYWLVGAKLDDGTTQWVWIGLR